MAFVVTNSNIIKKLRVGKGLTQEELGLIVGVQKAAIQKYENGSVENLKRSTIQKLATYFNVTPSYIMGMDDDCKCNENKLTDEEQELINNFRRASNKDKSIAKSVLAPETGTLSFIS